MSRVYVMLCLIILIAEPVAAQDAPRRLVTTPTAGTLSAGSYLVETHLFDGGGVTQRIAFGIAGLLDLGISYSGSNIVGSRPVTWQPHVGAQVQLRIVEESMYTPGIAAGFDSQGDGAYIEELDRFRQKSRGAYLVISRNYELLGNVGLHGGINYSFEDDDDRDPSFWAGIDKDLPGGVALCCEYDFATNDNDNDEITANRGYLNTALKLHLSRSFTLELNLRNMLRNEKRDLSGITEDRPDPARELRLTYISRF